MRELVTGGDGLACCERCGLVTRKAARWGSAVCPASALTRMDIDEIHSLVIGAAIVYCRRCGAYAEAKAVGLRFPCEGVPASCGALSWLARMRKGRHPRSGRGPWWGPHAPRPLAPDAVTCNAATLLT